VLRRLFIAGAVALVPASPAQAQGIRTLLLPGVSYSRQVEFTTHGPVAFHVINGPRPGGLYALKPALSNNAIVGRERVTSMQRSISASATVAGVNGDLFNWNDGHPSGMLMRSGVLDSPPLADRSSVGIGGDGSLQVARVSFAGIWRGVGQRRPLRFNQPPGANGVSLFTSSWGATTPAAPDVVEAVLSPFSPARPNTDLTGTVVQITQTNGNTRIPANSAVIVARGTGAARVAAEAPLGTSVFVRLALTPDWSSIPDAIGGGPVLVRDGKPVFRSSEAFSVSQLGPRNPRTAVGQLASGRVILVAVDGRQRGYSVGMTNFELASLMVRLGAVTASALDAGGSTTMAFEGTLLNRPSDPGGERAVAESLNLLYYGVYAPPPTEEVVSPNADGIAEAQRLEYKLVRPATVTATLTGPDGGQRVLETSQRSAGRYRLDWSGVKADGSPEPEGRWRFTVTAVDDQGQTSTTDRLFSLNNTLAALAVQPTVLVSPRGSSLRATFRLAHPATVRVTVERATGAVARTVLRRSYAEGPAEIGWDGRDTSRALAFRGRYVLRVRATNAFGRVDLTRPFSVRRR
jgi:flagellar hook assembly protein FlgD